MASTCVDRRDQTYINNQLVGSGPTTNADGSYTLAQVDVITQDLVDNILQQSEKNPVAIAANRFPDFYNVNTYLNTTFKDSVDTTAYPSLTNRWNRGAITPLEMADFMNAYNYTPNGIQNQTSTKLLGDLEKYYAGDIFESILGGFCKSMQNLFNQIDAFYDLIEEINTIITDAINFINKVREYGGIAKFVQDVIIQKLISEIKEKIIDAINKIYEKIEAAIANFDVLEQIGDLVTAIDKKHTKAVMTRKERLCNELTEETKKKLKDKVKGFIDYTIGLFENLDLEAVQFLVYRFCALASNIEALVNEIKNPLDSYGNRYERIVRRLQTISNVNTSTAIRNGAIRFSPEKRQEAINSLSSKWEGTDGRTRITPTGEDALTVPEITAQEYKDLPKCLAVFKGSDGRLGLEGDVFDEEKGLGLPAYTHVDLDVKVYLMRLQAMYGTKFIVTQGWLSKEYVDENNLNKDDSHLSGLVIDIKNTGFNDVDLFTQRAFESGFKYVVIYGGHIHLDIRDIPR